MNGYQKQLEFLDWEFGVFFHFGIRSFYPGHRDWDGLDMPAEGFTPDQLDCDQWITAAKDAGATYAILTCKHHDGFSLWPSAYSQYSVANTPWKQGKGDVVREFTDACRRHGLKVGLYYSPAQWGDHAIPFSCAKEYDDYFIHQISELLTNYGKIDYLWFDGCGSEGHEYDKPRIVKEIGRLQPDILTFCDPEWSPGVRWVGNEDGYASLHNPLTVSSTDFSILAKEEQALSCAMFLPSECDARIRTTWFHDHNEDTIKSAEELFGMYEMSVGHGSNFLLNIGPDNRGLLPEKDVARLHELGEKLRRVFEHPLPYTNPEQNGDLYTICHPEATTDDWQIPRKERLSNCLMIKEDLAHGQAVTGFRVWGYLPMNQNKKILLFMGTTIGHKLLCRFGAIRASRFELEITESTGAHTISEMKALYID